MWLSRTRSTLTLVCLHLTITSTPMSTMLAISPLYSVCELNTNTQRIGFWYGYKIKRRLIKENVYQIELWYPKTISFLYNNLRSRHNDGTKRYMSDDTCFFFGSFVIMLLYLNCFCTKSRIGHVFRSCHNLLSMYKQNHQNTPIDLIPLRSNNKAFTGHWLQGL